MDHSVTLDALGPERLRRFRSLTQTPALSWPVATLWVAVVSSYGLAWTGGLAGWMPL